MLKAMSDLCVTDLLQHRRWRAMDNVYYPRYIRSSGQFSDCHLGLALRDGCRHESFPTTYPTDSIPAGCFNCAADSECEHLFGYARPRQIEGSA
jgi:hypothetical protein